MNSIDVIVVTDHYGCFVSTLGKPDKFIALFDFAVDKAVCFIEGWLGNNVFGTKCDMLLFRGCDV